MDGDWAPSSSEYRTPETGHWRTFLGRPAADLDRPTVRAEILASGSLSGRYGRPSVPSASAR